MKLKEFYFVNKYRIISIGFLAVSVIVVILFFAASRSTRDRLYKAHQQILSWRNDKLTKDIDSIIEQKKQESESISEEILSIESELISVSKTREERDGLIENMSYRDLSDLLRRAAKQ